jgi:hypothetical protein
MRKLRRKLQITHTRNERGSIPDVKKWLGNIRNNVMPINSATWMKCINSFKNTNYQNTMKKILITPVAHIIFQNGIYS